jgi:hypothetical protein
MTIHVCVTVCVVKHRAGDEVLVSRGHPLQCPKPWTATVLERGGWELRLVSNDRLPADGTQLR